MRTDGDHCRESASTGPVVLKVVPVTCADFQGIPMDQSPCASLFPHLYSSATHCRLPRSKNGRLLLAPFPPHCIIYSIICRPLFKTIEGEICTRSYVSVQPKRIFGEAAKLLLTVYRGNRGNREQNTSNKHLFQMFFLIVSPSSKSSLCTA